MNVTRDRVRRFAAAAGTIGAIVCLGVLLLSVAFAPSSNWIVRTALLGFCILAVARPDAAIVVTTALVGFGIILSHLAGMPDLRVTETLVVASIAGFAIRSLVTPNPFRRALAASLSTPAVLFAIAGIASAAVWQRVYHMQVEDTSTYLQALTRFFTRDYFVLPGDFAVLTTTAVLVEGLALYTIVRALCRIDGTFFDRALRMMVIGGAGLGLMSVVRLAEILLRNPSAIQMLRDTSVGLRISPQIPDVIAAGSYFAVCWLGALGIALALPRWRLAWLAISVPLIAGLYLTGSRSVIGAAIAGLAVPAAVMLRMRLRAGRAVVIFASLAAVAMVVSYSWMSGRDLAGELAQQSLTVRAELLRAGARVIATRPLFGVGMDRFYLLAGEFASPQLRALWQGRMNPHNDFLRFGAELGLVGLALFLWILIEAVIRIRGDLAATRDARLAGLAGGLVAFLVTSLFSNPLMVREVSYVFWIALGLAVGHAARPDVLPIPDGVSSQPNRALAWRRGLGLAIGVVLILSIPFRATTEMTTIDPGRTTYGVYEWTTDADGARYRWSGQRATLFIDKRARLVEIPLQGAAPAGATQHVEIRVDGRLADRIEIGGEWRRLRTLLPGSPGSAPHRIDFSISPTWIEADVVPGSQDRRTVGVKIGETSVVVGGPTR